MNRPLLLAIGATTLLVHLVGCASQPVAARNDADRFAYGVGFDLGNSVREGLADDGIEADVALIRRGFEDGLGGRRAALPKHEMDRVLRAVHRETAERQARRLYAEDPEFRAVADANAAASQTMVASFAARPGARRLDSGAYAIVEAEGSGRTVGEDSIAIADQVLSEDSAGVERSGWPARGVAFDSRYRSGYRFVSAPTDRTKSSAL
jgi:FKBP-type peptidyl-prolyl cis-trans isomerase